MLRHRSALVDAAATLAADVGSEARVSDIVRLARTSKTTFYEHFESRDHCLVEVYRRAHEGLLRDVKAAVPRNAESLDAIAAAFVGLREALGRSPQVAALLRAEQRAGSPVIAQTRRANLRRLVGALVELGRRPGPWIGTPNVEQLTRVLVYGLIADESAFDDRS